MAAFSNYLSNKLIDHARGVSAYALPTVYMALLTSTSTATTPGTEATYTGYARVPLSGLLSAAASQSGTNGSAINFPTCTGGTNTVNNFATFDALTGGNMLEYGSTPSLAVSANITPQFAAGTFVTTLV